MAVFDDNYSCSEMVTQIIQFELLFENNINTVLCTNGITLFSHKPKSYLAMGMNPVYSKNYISFINLFKLHFQTLYHNIRLTSLYPVYKRAFKRLSLYNILITRCSRRCLVVAYN